MINTICFPDYSHSVLGIPNSILKYYGVPTDYPTLPVLDKALRTGYKNIVMWVLDGLGTDMLQRNLSARSFLRNAVIDEISSVFPPTTTAATTTYYSGLPPISHGWIGWSPYFPEYGRNIALFSGCDVETGEPIVDISAVIPRSHIFEKLKSIVPCSEVFPKKLRPNGVDSFPEACQRILEISRQAGPQFTIAYWPDPDHTSHYTGVTSPETKAQIRCINTEIRKLSEKLTDTLLIISADHGHVPIKKNIFIEDYPELAACLRAPMALDDRVSTIFLKPDTEQTFLSSFQKYLSKDFILMKSEQAIQNGLFGTGPIHPRLRDFLGDYLLIGIGDICLRQRSDPGKQFKSCHAGLHPYEMRVPLILIRT